MTSPGRSPEFCWDARAYHTSSSVQEQWAEELILKLALRSDEQVLDIGCGDGKVTAALAGAVPGGRVIDIDCSPDMIRFARERFSPAEYPNLAFVEMDARNLNFLQEFDVIFSNAALHWIPNHGPVLAGVNRSLHHGGRMLVQMGGKGNAAQVFEVLYVLMQEERWSRFFADFPFPYSFFTPDDYRGFLDSAGLRPVRVELIPKDMAYRTHADFSSWIRTTWLPYLARLPEGLRQEFIDALIDRYMEVYPVDPDGIIHIGMVRLEVEAVK